MSVFIPKTQSAPAEVLVELSRRFGQKLLQDYLSFAKIHDGAKPADNIFEIGPGNSAGIDEFITAGEALDLGESVEGLPRSVLPLARASGGNFVYLDPKNGGIFFWDHEQNSSPIRIAQSLGEFLLKLRPFDSSQVKLKPGQVKRTWVDPNFTPEF